MRARARKGPHTLLAAAARRGGGRGRAGQAQTQNGGTS
eukprot:gene42115-32236_t